MSQGTIWPMQVRQSAPRGQPVEVARSPRWTGRFVDAFPGWYELAVGFGAVVCLLVALAG
jgi:hypothetical protein